MTVDTQTVWIQAGEWISYSFVCVPHSVWMEYSSHSDLALLWSPTLHWESVNDT